MPPAPDIERNPTKPPNITHTTVTQRTLYARCPTSRRTTQEPRKSANIRKGSKRMESEQVSLPKIKKWNFRNSGWKLRKMRYHNYVGTFGWKLRKMRYHNFVDKFSLAPFLNIASWTLSAIARYRFTLHIESEDRETISFK